MIGSSTASTSSSRLEASEWLDAASEMASRLSEVLPIEPSSWLRLNRVRFSPAAPLIFWGLNGFLLGREYFTLAAIRRVGRKEAKVLRTRYLGTIWLAGFLMAIPLSIPILNLIIPILGAATFTHLFHRLSPQAPYG